MKYTFLLPAYKGRYLENMLQSIQRQTYTDYKVIISDDCSPEDLYGICEPYLADPRFKYRRNEYNMGSKSLVSHWNLLINACDTEYLILASDDDIYDDRFLEEIDNLMQKYPNVNLLRARSRRINDVGEPYEQDYIYEELENPLDFICSSFCQDRIHCIGNYVFKTSTLKNNGGFVDFPMAWFSDDATVFSCGLNGVANTPDILFNFRISSINISNSNIRNCEMAKIKIDAACSFLEWMNSFVKHLSFPNTLYNRKQFEKVCNGYRYRVRKQIYYYYYQLDFKSLTVLVKWMKANGFFASNKRIMLFILRWVKYTISNGVRKI